LNTVDASRSDTIRDALSADRRTLEAVVDEDDLVLTPGAVAQVIEPLEVWWAVAGGWAIDQWIG
jgi:hypothetical protein